MTAHTPTGWRGVFRRLHLPLLLLIVLCTLLNWGVMQRSLLYLNFFGLLAYATFSGRSLSSQTSGLIRPSPVALALLAVPLLFTGLHWIAVGHIEIIKEIRHLWLAVFLAVSIWACGSRLNLLKGKLEQVMVLLLGVYIVAEVVAVGVMGRPYGTNKNPHYLAFYASIALILAAYLFCLTKAWWRAALLIMSPAIIYLILLSSSRPAWIALVLAGVLTTMMASQKARWLRLLLIIAICGFLFSSNFMNFGSRMTELATHISQEERVTIWEDTWRMQQVSTPAEWIWGHGLDSFQETFKGYSHYRGIMDFNSPHNTFLDLLYISGIAGVITLMSLYIMLYMNLFAMHATAFTKLSARYLIILLTFNLTFMFITMPTFSPFNLYVLAMAAGLTRSLDAKRRYL